MFFQCGPLDSSQALKASALHKAKWLLLINCNKSQSPDLPSSHEALLEEWIIILCCYFTWLRTLLKNYTFLYSVNAWMLIWGSKYFTTYILHLLVSWSWSLKTQCTNGAYMTVSGEQKQIIYNIKCILAMTF